MKNADIDADVAQPDVRVPSLPCVASKADAASRHLHATYLRQARHDDAVETRLLLTIRVEVAVDDEQLLIDALRESPRGSATGVHTVRPTTALMTLLKTDAITQAIQTVPGVRPVGGEVDVVPDDGQDHPWGPELPESVAWYRHTGVSRTL